MIDQPPAADDGFGVFSPQRPHGGEALRVSPFVVAVHDQPGPVSEKGTDGLIFTGMRCH